MRDTTKDQANTATANELKDRLAQATTANEQREIIRQLSEILIDIVAVWTRKFHASFAGTVEFDDLNGTAHVAIFSELNSLAGNPAKLNSIRDLLGHLHTIALRECQHESNENGFVDRRDVTYIEKARRELEAAGQEATPAAVATLANSYNAGGERQHRRTLTADDVRGIHVSSVEDAAVAEWMPATANTEDEALAPEHSRQLAAQALSALTDNERGLVLSVLVEGNSRVKVCNQFGYTTREVPGVIETLIAKMRSALGGLDLADLSYAA
ncbi:hypothetical protein [Leifsonia sp. fls2-241-R2A-40a]|uniref:hypothetical protein n=1 Tax=Leifsonia sp. fls2-241-R2A-40a TaxID=3040290 RepID=UPI00255049B2|nr:hypothetical protein [Leifsonia sp. fls2-241-R2A-40a]